MFGLNGRECTETDGAASWLLVRGRRGTLGENPVIRTLRIYIFVGLIVSTLFALRANAQTVTAGVTGTITDPSGATIRGAVVTAHDLDTNVSTSTSTNADGVYRIEHLPIGRYEVIANATGFSSETLPSFSLEALQTVTFNAKLTLRVRACPWKSPPPHRFWTRRTIPSAVRSRRTPSRTSTERWTQRADTLYAGRGEHLWQHRHQRHRA